MIHSGAIQSQRPYMRILSDAQIFEIRRAAFDIMYSVGFRVLHDGARQVIGDIGPGGHFLAHRHTVDHCRTAVWGSKVLAAMAEIREAGVKELTAG
jgi:trimethylamine--corrinoid protein Co-methyltransferase